VSVSIDSGMESVVYNNIVNAKMNKNMIEFRNMVLIFFSTIIFLTIIGFISNRTEPAFVANTDQEFLQSLNKCINYLEKNIPAEQKIDRKLIITKAALESNFGKSRFAIQGNNLFGIRQFSNLENGILPIKVSSTANWRVATFNSKCDSVKYYINLLNYNHHYEDFRNERAYQRNNNINITTRYFIKLEKYATNPNYPNLLMKTYLKIYETK